MTSPYEKCPVYENENYLLRLLEPSDADDLFFVYSDEKAVPLFNSDNCIGGFHFTSLEQTQNAIKFWLEAYQRKEFVRWSIVDKKVHRTVGTIELFNRRAEDYFDNCGLLRLDLRSDYENAESIVEILSLIVQAIPELFECRMIATKVPPFATERKLAVERLGFAASEEKLLGGHSGKAYTDYYVSHA